MEEETQNKSNNVNTVNIENHSSYCLLDKLQIMKEHQASNQIIVKDHSIALIKSSNDFDISRLCSLFVSAPFNNIPIGLRLFIKTIPIAEKTVLNLRVYEYNYLLSKKFKYLRSEAMNSSLTFLILVNIYDKKCLNNLKEIIDEVSLKGINNNSYLNINYQNTSSLNNQQINNNKNIVIVLLKTTDNFLLKITEKQNVINTKSEIENILNGFKIKIVEIDIDEITNINHTLLDLIK